jgi:pimeloyl-ACP methyl ester carboxylesterase
LVVSLISALSLAALAGGAVVGGKARAREADVMQDFPPEGEFVEVAGRRVHLKVMGQGPDLVMIHGASGNLRDFTFGFAQRMAADFRVIAVDRPGLGYSDRIADSHAAVFAGDAESLTDQARHLAAAVRQVGAERPLLLGHSYGGAVALAWALSEPAAGLVSLGGVAMPWPGAELDLYYTLNGSRVGGAVVPPLIAAFASDARVQDAIAAVFAPQTPPEGYGDHVGAELTVRRASLRANARQVRRLHADVAALSGRYPDLTLPVEFVHGDADPVVPLAVHSGPATGLIPGAVLTVLPGVGHMPHHVAPEAAADAIHRVASRAGLR